jgi:hypothetical protein
MPQTNIALSGARVEGDSANYGTNLTGKLQSHGDTAWKRSLWAMALSGVQISPVLWEAYFASALVKDEPLSLG